jgi:hypothetical protein
MLPERLKPGLHRNAALYVSRSQNDSILARSWKNDHVCGNAHFWLSMCLPEAFREQANHYSMEQDEANRHTNLLESARQFRAALAYLRKWSTKIGEQTGCPRRFERCLSRVKIIHFEE